MAGIFTRLKWWFYRKRYGKPSDEELSVTLKDVLGARAGNANPNLQGHAVHAGGCCVVNFDDGSGSVCANNVPDSAACTSYATALGGTGFFNQGAACPAGSRVVGRP